MNLSQFSENYSWSLSYGFKKGTTPQNAESFREFYRNAFPELISLDLLDQSFWNLVCLWLGPFWWTSHWSRNKISGISGKIPEFSGKSGIFEISVSLLININIYAFILIILVGTTLKSHPNCDFDLFSPFLVRPRSLLWPMTWTTIVPRWKFLYHQKAY